jgi:hypothetical protein
MDGSEQMNDLARRPLYSLIERAFKNPVVGMIGWAATVLGFLLAFYFYFSAQETPDLTYFVRPNRTALVAVGDTPGITITYKDHELTKNVSAAQIVIWNAGKRPIRREDVLSPYVISLQGSHPIVTAKIVGLSNPVTEFRVIETNMQSGQLAMDWRVLEHNDGAVVQVLYEGNTTVPIQLNGISIGQRSITLRTLPKDYMAFTLDKWPGHLLISLNIIILLILPFIIYEDVRQLSARKGRRVKLRLQVAIQVITLFCFAAILVTHYGTNFWNPPPFGY